MTLFNYTQFLSILVQLLCTLTYDTYLNTKQALPEKKIIIAPCLGNR